MPEKKRSPGRSWASCFMGFALLSGLSWRPGKAELLGCRLGCCLPVADAQHRPKWQRRPVLNGPHWGPGPPCFPSFSFATLCVAFKAVRLRLTNRKLFEKSLTKNFYAPPPLPQARGRLVLPGHGQTFTPLRGCAFYSKLLYSSAISSSLVSLGLPGQQASA